MAGYVTDTGNHRLQKFASDGFFLAAFGSQGSSLSQFNSPKGLTFAGDGSLLIADTGNNRIVIVTRPKVVPDNVWSDTRTKLINAQTEDALKNFSVTTVDIYRQEFANLGAALVSQYMGELNAALSPAYIDSDEALYYFTSTISSVQFTFFVSFAKENGQWKIRTF